jgi:hypothetical protein
MVATAFLVFYRFKTINKEEAEKALRHFAEVFNNDSATFNCKWYK